MTNAGTPHPHTGKTKHFVRFSNLASIIKDVLQFDKKNLPCRKKNCILKSYTILVELCISQRIEILSEVASFLIHAFARYQI